MGVTILDRNKVQDGWDLSVIGEDSERIIYHRSKEQGAPPDWKDWVSSIDAERILSAKVLVTTSDDDIDIIGPDGTPL